MTIVKEISFGFLIALVIFLAFHGINLTPFIFLGIMVYFMIQIIDRKDVGNKVEAVGAASTHQGSITFADIGGQDSAINELKEALDFINHEEKILRLGIRPLKGILLSGPPGTGKTLMAKAAANYTNSIFLSVSGSEFIEMYAGVGAQRVRKLFQNAEKKAKKENKDSAIIFIDEIDVLGGKRGRTSSHLEYDQTLNQLLVEMDGLKTEAEVRILLIAATNRIDILDPALLRPGRFDRIVKVDLPAREGRLEILRIHTLNKPLAPSVNLDAIAGQTFGFSGAQLESVTNEAAILAFRENLEYLEQRHFVEAIDKVIMGEKLDRKPEPEELKRIAYHEGGHALLAEILNPGSVSQVTITSRGQALGYVRHFPDGDRYLMTQEYIEDQIAICIAGAVSEEIFLKNRSTGAKNDFEKAISLAEEMINAGMTPLGVVKTQNLPQNLKHETTSRILKNQEERVRDILKQHRENLIKIVEILLDKERIDGEQLREIIKCPDLLAG